MPQGAVGTVIAAILLLAGISCGAGGTPTPTLTSTRPPEATATQEPPPTFTPTPTAAPTPTATTPAPTATSVPTEPPEDLATSRLLDTLERLPLSFKDKGVWFNHVGRALELARAPQPRSSEEYLALGEAERAAYREALRGSAPSGFLIGMRTRIQGYEETFGFGSFDVDLAVTTGENSLHPLQPNFLEGEFDESLIRQRLVDLGYQERAAGGRTYYAIREDYEIDSSDPASRLAITSIVNRLFVGDGVLIGAPSTDLMTSILEAWAGAAPSLAEDPAFSSLARALEDPLAAALLTRSVALKLLPTSEPQPFESLEEYEKPPEWGSLHLWEVLGVGAGEDSEGRWMAFSLYYSNPDAAAADAEELVRRMEGYTTLVPQLYPTSEGLAEWPEHPLNKSCQSLLPNVQSDDRGSTLTVRCPLTDGPVAWVQFVDFRDLGFLVP